MPASPCPAEPLRSRSGVGHASQPLRFAHPIHLLLGSIHLFTETAVLFSLHPAEGVEQPLNLNSWSLMTIKTLSCHLSRWLCNIIQLLRKIRERLAKPGRPRVAVEAKPSEQEVLTRDPGERRPRRPTRPLGLLRGGGEGCPERSLRVWRLHRSRRAVRWARTGLCKWPASRAAAPKGTSLSNEISCSDLGDL